MSWPRKYRTFWCVIDGQGTAYLSTARAKRSRSIAAWLTELGADRRDWSRWRRHKYTCQRVDIKVRNALV